MPHWKFFLADAKDLRIRQDELVQARARTLNLVHNRGGSLSFTFPMNHPLAAQINPLTSAVIAYRQVQNPSSAQYGQWQPIWSGAVWTIDESIHEKHMTVNCVGWLETLPKRLLRTPKNYVNVDDGDIVLDMLAEANRTSWIAGGSAQDMNYTVPVLAGSYPSTPTRIQAGSKLPNQGSGGATAYVAQNRSVQYQRYISVTQVMIEMTEMENGCDIEITPIDRFLNVYRKKQKITNEVFGYEWGPANLSQFSRQIDSSTVVNLIQVSGTQGVAPQWGDTASPFAGLPIGTSGAVDPDPDTRDDFGLFEEVVSLPNVNSASVLQSYGMGELFVRYRPRVTYSMTPFPYTPGIKSVPEPFVDYNVGDRVYLSARLLPRILIQNQAVRVFGMSVQIDEEGNERLGALMTAPGG